MITRKAATLSLLAGIILLLGGGALTVHAFQRCDQDSCPDVPVREPQAPAAATTDNLPATYDFTFNVFCSDRGRGDTTCDQWTQLPPNAINNYQIISADLTLTQTYIDDGTFLEPPSMRVDLCTGTAPGSGFINCATPWITYMGVPGTFNAPANPWRYTFQPDPSNLTLADARALGVRIWVNNADIRADLVIHARRVHVNTFNFNADQSRICWSATNALAGIRVIGPDGSQIGGSGGALSTPETCADTTGPGDYAISASGPGPGLNGSPPATVKMTSPLFAQVAYHYGCGTNNTCRLLNGPPPDTDGCNSTNVGKACGGGTGAYRCGGGGGCIWDANLAPGTPHSWSSLEACNQSGECGPTGGHYYCDSANNTCEYSDQAGSNTDGCDSAASGKSCIPGGGFTCQYDSCAADANSGQSYSSCFAACGGKSHFACDPSTSSCVLINIPGPNTGGCTSAGGKCTPTASLYRCAGGGGCTVCNPGDGCEISKGNAWDSNQACLNSGKCGGSGGFVCQNNSCQYSGGGTATLAQCQATCGTGGGGNKTCNPPQWKGFALDGCWDNNGTADCSRTQEVANAWCQTSCGASNATGYQTAWGQPGTTYYPTGRTCPQCSFGFTSITCAGGPPPPPPPKTTHNACLTDGSCTVVSGAGSDQCKSWQDCPQPAPTCSMTLNPSTVVIPPPRTVTMSWTSQYAQSITITPQLGNCPGTTAQASGSCTFTPQTSVDFTMTCTGPGGTSDGTTGKKPRIRAFTLQGGSLKEIPPGH